MTMRELVRKARSIRRFKDNDPIPEAHLRDLVDLARLAASGGNQQPLRYRLVSTATECQMVFPHTAWAGHLKDWKGPAIGERPTGYILILAEHEHDVDVGIAAQTIQLAAAEMGYGSCMLGAIKRDEIKAALRIPAQFKLALALALGKPAETIVLEDAKAGDSLKYYRTPDGVHHVPKLRLADVIVR